MIRICPAKRGKYQGGGSSGMAEYHFRILLHIMGWGFESDKFKKTPVADNARRPRMPTPKVKLLAYFPLVGLYTHTP